jgi:tetratricopeptide (TPR) repeat protein
VPVFVLCLARKELLDRRPAWAMGPSDEIVALESLGRDECDALLRGLLGTLDVPVEVTTAIEGVGAGNPLFAEELIAMLIDEGLLVRDDGQWMPSPDLAHVAVPPTVQALLAARLDQLAVTERRILEGASVVGEVFEWGAVAELVPPELRTDLGGSLMSLVRKEVIRPAPSDLSDQDAFRFRHLLIRDAAYEGMAKETRAELHQRFARWLEGGAPERFSEVQAIVGYHLERAFTYREELGAAPGVWTPLGREAARSLGQAGRRALARGDMPAAANLLGRALALLPAADGERATLVIDLVDVFREMGEFERVHALVDEGTALARDIGDRGLELRFELRRLYLRLMGDPKHILLRDVIENAEAIAAEAAAIGDPVAEGEALLRAGRALGDVGRTYEGEGLIARSIACFERADVSSSEMAFVTALTFTWQGPRPVADDIEQGMRALAAADEGSPVAAFHLIGLAVGQAMTGDIREARAFLGRGASILRELGMTLELAATAGLYGAVVEMLAGDLQAAEAAIRTSYDTLKSKGEKARLSSRAALLARVVYQLGRYDEAMDLADEADSVSTLDDMEPQIWLRGVRAKVLARGGRFEDAERVARENARLAEETDWPGYTGTAWTDVVEVLHLAGRPDDAAAAARRAEDLFEEKGDVVSLDRVRTFREEIEAGRVEE